MQLLFNFIAGYFTKALYIPLVTFYVAPIVIVAISIQDAGFAWLSRAIFYLLFIGATSKGDFEIEGEEELIASVAIWLFVVQVVAMLAHGWFERRKMRLNTGKIARISLIALYVLAYIGVMASSHQGTAWEFAAVFAALCAMGLGLLALYQAPGFLFKRFVTFAKDYAEKNPS